MNIFRVLASGKLTIREEFVSAFLAYLLNPRMDHGLGSEVLKRLARQVGRELDFAPLLALSGRLEPKFRSALDDSGEQDILVDLEVAYAVPGTQRTGFIDVVIKSRECFILIENKISLSSTTERQLAEQYQ